MTFPDALPKLCPECGSPYSGEFVEGWHGWICGSYNASHVRHGDRERFIQSIDCAVLHWKTRALKAEADLNWLENAAWTDGRIGNGLVLWPYTDTRTGVRGFALQDLGDEDGSSLGDEIAKGPTLRECIEVARATVTTL